MSEWLEKWKWPIGLALVAAGVGCTVAFDDWQPAIAVGLALAGPVVVLLVGAAKTLDGPTGLLLGAAVVALLAAVAAEAELLPILVPGEPLAEATLTTARPEADLGVPDDVPAVTLDLEGQVSPGAPGDASSRYRVEVARGSTEKVVVGHLRRVHHAGSVGRRGRGASGGAIEIERLERKALELPPPGPVHVRLAELDGNLRSPIHVAAFAAPPIDAPWIVALFGIAFFAAVLLQGLGARFAVQAPLAAAVTGAAVLAFYVAHQFDPEHPLKTVLAGIVVGLFGAGAGHFAGSVAEVVLKRRPAPPGAPPEGEMS